jgi:hypothetical protein
MTGLEPEDSAQVKKEEKKIVEETEQAGGTVHEFNPDATPQQKAAAAAKVSIAFRPLSNCSLCPLASTSRKLQEEQHWSRIWYVPYTIASRL